MNILVFDVKNEELVLSNLSKTIPSNFYGNIPTTNPKNLFYPWQKKYRDYIDKITNRYNTYCETNEYKYEISLDLVNFFPSINPLVLYSDIYDQLTVYCSNDELDKYKVILKKLLYLKVNNIGSYKAEYYGELHDSIETNFTLGIPQGLPHAYYLSNLYMTKVSKIFDESFTLNMEQSNSLYYVDDSVIFTKKEINNKEFLKELNNINTKLEKLNTPPEAIKLGTDIDNFNAKTVYSLKVHIPESIEDNKCKSTFSEISDKKYGESFLNNVGRVASIGLLEMKSIFNENNEVNLINQFKAMEESIDNEIERVDKLDKLEKKDSVGHYKKLLIRYKKFFNYRKRILETNNEEVISEEEVETFLKKINFKRTEMAKIEKFFSYYDEDTFFSDFLLLAKQNEIEKFNKGIKKLDEEIYEKHYEQVAFFNKMNESIQFVRKLRKFTSYDSLEHEIKYRTETLSRKHAKIKNTYIQEKILPYIADNESYKNGVIYALGEEYSLILHNSTELQRKILNGYISSIFSSYINDEKNILKKSNESVKYYEFRVLMYLRNGNFNVKDFIYFMNEINENVGITNEDIDYTLVSAVPYFFKYIRTPNEIDKLIQIHRYTNSIWKNGSKYLHFYTLHNHEHGVDLIKNALNFFKSIHYFNIKKIDYYILFISCYLHDISMVIHPDLPKLAYEENQNLSLLYGSFRREIKELKDDLDDYEKTKNPIKTLLLNYYKKLDEYFENSVRANHPKQSASFVRKAKELHFLETSIKDIVAEVSEAHGYAPHDIYDVKSEAKDALISKKYIKIGLRIADLLDISKERISEPIINNNFKFMSNTSQFHWLSHKIIDSYEITTDYIGKEKTKVDKGSYLGRKEIKELVNITIYVNTNRLSKVKKSEGVCKSGVSLDSIIKEETSLELSFNKECEQRNCNFLCKWMKVKNDYLYQELGKMEKYLNNSNNYFNTEFRVKVVASKQDKLSSSEYDLLLNYIK